jgi:mRNA interferase RelE/StbE
VADPYTVYYGKQAADDVRKLRAFDRVRILRGVEQHLIHDPGRTSRSRIKKMTEPFWCQYRLRIDEYRVYYDVSEADRSVNVVRVMRKTTGQTPEESK